MSLDATLAGQRRETPADPRESSVYRQYQAIQARKAGQAPRMGVAESLGKAAESVFGVASDVAGGIQSWQEGVQARHEAAAEELRGRPGAPGVILDEARRRERAAERVGARAGAAGVAETAFESVGDYFGRLGEGFQAVSDGDVAFGDVMEAFSNEFLNTGAAMLTARERAERGEEYEPPSGRAFRIPDGATQRQADALRLWGSLGSTAASGVPSAAGILVQLGAKAARLPDFVGKNAARLIGSLPLAAVEYYEAFGDAKATGASDEEASAHGFQMAGAAGVAEFVGQAGILKGATGVAKGVHRRNVRGAVAALAKAAHQEGLTEAATEVAQGAIQGRNITGIGGMAGAQEGARTAGEAYAGGAILGGGLAAVGGAGNRLLTRRDRKAAIAKAEKDRAGQLAVDEMERLDRRLFAPPQAQAPLLEAERVMPEFALPSSAAESPEPRTGRQGRALEKLEGAGRKLREFNESQEIILPVPDMLAAKDEAAGRPLEGRERLVAMADAAGARLRFLFERGQRGVEQQGGNPIENLDDAGRAELAEINRLLGELGLGAEVIQKSESRRGEGAQRADKRFVLRLVEKEGGPPEGGLLNAALKADRQVFRQARRAAQLEKKLERRYEAARRTGAIRGGGAAGPRGPDRSQMTGQSTEAFGKGEVPAEVAELSGRLQNDIVIAGRGEDGSIVWGPASDILDDGRVPVKVAPLTPDAEGVNAELARIGEDSGLAREYIQGLSEAAADNFAEAMDWGMDPEDPAILDQMEEADVQHQLNSMVEAADETMDSPEDFEEWEDLMIRRHQEEQTEAAAAAEAAGVVPTDPDDVYAQYEADMWSFEADDQRTSPKSRWLRSRRNKALAALGRGQDQNPADPEEERAAFDEQRAVEDAQGFTNETASPIVDWTTSRMLGAVLAIDEEARNRQFPGSLAVLKLWWRDDPADAPNADFVRTVRDAQVALASRVLTEEGKRGRPLTNDELLGVYTNAMLTGAIPAFFSSPRKMNTSPLGFRGYGPKVEVGKRGKGFPKMQSIVEGVNALFGYTAFQVDPEGRELSTPGIEYFKPGYADAEAAAGAARVAVFAPEKVGILRKDQQEVPTPRMARWIAKLVTGNPRVATRGFQPKIADHLEPLALAMEAVDTAAATPEGQAEMVRLTGLSPDDTTFGTKGAEAFFAGMLTSRDIVAEVAPALTAAFEDQLSRKRQGLDARRARKNFTDLQTKMHRWHWGRPTARDYGAANRPDRGGKVWQRFLAGSLGERWTYNTLGGAFSNLTGSQFKFETLGDLVDGVIGRELLHSAHDYQQSDAVVWEAFNTGELPTGIHTTGRLAGTTKWETAETPGTFIQKVAGNDMGVDFDGVTPGQAARRMQVAVLNREVHGEPLQDPETIGADPDPRWSEARKRQWADAKTRADQHWALMREHDAMQAALQNFERKLGVTEGRGSLFSRQAQVAVAAQELREFVPSDNPLEDMLGEFRARIRLAYLKKVRLNMVEAARRADGGTGTMVSFYWMRASMPEAAADGEKPGPEAGTNPVLLRQFLRGAAESFVKAAGAADMVVSEGADGLVLTEVGEEGSRPVAEPVERLVREAVENGRDPLNFLSGARPERILEGTVGSAVMPLYTPGAGADVRDSLKLVEIRHPQLLRAAHIPKQYVPRNSISKTWLWIRRQKQNWMSNAPAFFFPAMARDAFTTPVHGHTYRSVPVITTAWGGMVQGAVWLRNKALGRDGFRRVVARNPKLMKILEGEDGWFEEQAAVRRDLQTAMRNATRIEGADSLDALLRKMTDPTKVGRPEDEASVLPVKWRGDLLKTVLREWGGLRPARRKYESGVRIATELPTRTGQASIERQALLREVQGEGGTILAIEKRLENANIPLPGRMQSVRNVHREAIRAGSVGGLNFGERQESAALQVVGTHALYARAGMNGLFNEAVLARRIVRALAGKGRESYGDAALRPPMGKLVMAQALSMGLTGAYAGARMWVAADEDREREYRRKSVWERHRALTGVFRVVLSQIWKTDLTDEDRMAYGREQVMNLAQGALAAAEGDAYMTRSLRRLSEQLRTGYDPDTTIQIQPEQAAWFLPEEELAYLPPARHGELPDEVLHFVYPQAGSYELDPRGLVEWYGRRAEGESVITYDKMTPGQQALWDATVALPFGLTKQLTVLPVVGYDLLTSWGLFAPDPDDKENWSKWEKARAAGRKISPGPQETVETLVHLVGSLEDETAPWLRHNEARAIYDLLVHDEVSYTGAHVVRRSEQDLYPSLQSRGAAPWVVETAEAWNRGLTALGNGIAPSNQTLARWAEKGTVSGQVMESLIEWALPMWKKNLDPVFAEFTEVPWDEKKDGVNPWAPGKFSWGRLFRGSGEASRFLDKSSGKPYVTHWFDRASVADQGRRVFNVFDETSKRAAVYKGLGHALQQGQKDFSTMPASDLANMAVWAGIMQPGTTKVSLPHRLTANGVRPALYAEMNSLRDNIQSLDPEAPNSVGKGPGNLAAKQDAIVKRLRLVNRTARRQLAHMEDTVDPVVEGLENAIRQARREGKDVVKVIDDWMNTDEKLARPASSR